MSTGELREWVRKQRSLSVAFRGDQHQLFDQEAVRVFELYGDDGDSKLATEAMLFEIMLP